MKCSEMNEHQSLVFNLMSNYMSEMIGGCENTLTDCEDGEEEYIRAKRYLSMGHDALKQDIYNAVMAECKNGTYASHAKFAGKEFLMERIECRLVKWGY